MSPPQAQKGMNAEGERLPVVSMMCTGWLAWYFLDIISMIIYRFTIINIIIIFIITIVIIIAATITIAVAKTRTCT